jgi:hypothetical protein
MKYTNFSPRTVKTGERTSYFPAMKSAGPCHHDVPEFFAELAVHRMSQFSAGKTGKEVRSREMSVKCVLTFFVSAIGFDCFDAYSLLAERQSRAV